MPRYHYLTRSFVEALGLEPIVMKAMRNTAVRCIFDENGMIPPPEPLYFNAVLFEGELFKREADGLAWAHLPTSGW